MAGVVVKIKLVDLLDFDNPWRGRFSPEDSQYSIHQRC